MKRLLTSLFAFALILGSVGVFSTVRASSILNASDLNPGDLFRTVSSPAVYYYGMDGTRYVFPNSSTYFTWYENFNNVKTIADAEIFEITLGGNVTYRPGTRMVKVTTIPDTYAIDKDGTLRHVSSEAVAVALYGANWNKMIDDLPDAFFPNYNVGEPITDASQFNLTDAKSTSPDINTDKALIAPQVVRIKSSGFDPELATIAPNQTVRFENADSVPHTVTADSLRWGSGTMQPGDVYIRRFKEEGVETYFDSLNSQNTGTLMVE